MTVNDSIYIPPCFVKSIMVEDSPLPLQPTVTTSMVTTSTVYGTNDLKINFKWDGYY